jgi:UDP-GlcNAc:undecaprenyl-phosphate GlcNAc-1-phosphate transferase
MTLEIRSLLTFLAAFFSALYVMPNLSHIANRIGLIDIPNDRKLHLRPRPLVGGIGIVIAATFSSLVFISLQGLRGYFAGLAVLLLVGFFDDFQEVGHKKKFLAQIVATTLLVYLSKVYLADFGNLLGFGSIIVPDISWLTLAVTVFCVVGGTNAVNMIDGIDGLAGGVTLVAFLTFAALASLAGNNVLMLLNLALAGAVLGFLRYNWAPSMLFMGDAGSLCLGFSLSFMAIALTQGEGSLIKPVIALLVLAVPISDTLVVMIKRVMKGRSPFEPDKTHLHHLFVKHGLDGYIPVKTILLLCVFLSAIGVTGAILRIYQPVLFGVFIGYFILNWHADFIVGKVSKSLKIVSRREKSQNIPVAVHSIFQNIQSQRFFRGSRRFDVEFDFEIACEMDTSHILLPGKVLNISKSGFMASIDEFGFICRECTATMSLPGEEEPLVIEMPVEHLWMTTKGEYQYHGFQFLDLTDTQSDILTRLIHRQMMSL